MKSDKAKTENSAFDIAIIGMAGRFPGADSVHEYWNNLVLEKESITWHNVFTPPKGKNEPWPVPAGFLLKNMDKFDEKFFKMSPMEAALTDPQQRLLLQCAWQAIEDAGYAAKIEKEIVGVYVSTGPSNYLINNVIKNSKLMAGTDPIQIQIANDKDYSANRISYKLNLNGPSVVVQSACSSSLLAVHLAVQSLIAGECNISLAGGMSLEVSGDTGYIHTPGSILSEDGHCKPFSDEASGTVRGNGGGVVILKRLEDALNDNDHIYGIICGSATNNDGARKIGYAAPSIDGQSEVINETLAVANLSSDLIGYIETHGTGTSLGDPIEIAALTKVFKDRRNGVNCFIGSVKSNIGHLDAAAGIAGLIKATLCVYNGYIPGTLHFSKPNRKIDFERSPFEVVTKGRVWDSHLPRRAGVSSFGIGGSNVHVIIEEHSTKKFPINFTDEPLIIAVSAKTETSLNSFADSLATYLEGNPDLCLGDVQYSLNVGRKSFEHRIAIVADSVSSAIKQLREVRQKAVKGIVKNEVAELTLMFPGQGTLFREMAKNYYRPGEVFKENFDKIAELAEPLIGHDLIDAVFNPLSELDLSATWLSQIALFAVEYSLARHWMAQGLRPKSMIGHSIGEYVAATISGVFTLPDAVTIVAARGRLMQKMSRGSMLAIRESIENIQPLLPSGISIAAINQPKLFVVSGSVEEVEKIRDQLLGANIPCRLLETSHAFHSSMMDPCLWEFAKVLETIPKNQPQIPFVSNLTGDWIRPEEALSVDYWVQHLRGTVYFADGISTLLKQASQVFIECGPGKSLSSAVNEIAKRQDRSSSALPLIPNSEYKVDLQVETLRVEAQLWCVGYELKTRTIPGAKTISLPTYCFDHNKHWIEPDPQTALSVAGPTQQIQERKKDLLQIDSKDEKVNTLQSKMALIWCEALGLENIDYDSNFFDLGGDSILNIKITNCARKRGISIDPGNLLEFPTVNKLCEFIQSKRPGDFYHDENSYKDQEIIRNAFKPNPEERFKPFPLTDIQHAYWLGKNSGTISAHAYEEFECFNFDLSRLEAALKYVITRHDMLRAIVNDEGQQQILSTVPHYKIRSNNFTNLLPIEAEKEVSKFRETMSHQVMPSDQWPLFDIAVSKMPDGTSRLHISFDLLIMDAWSITIFWRELEESYHNPQLALDPVGISFRDYVLAEKILKGKSGYSNAKKYWLDRAGEFPLAPELPLLQNPDKLTRYKFSRIEAKIDKNIWKKLKTISSQKGLTPSTVLCTAYAEILATRAVSPHFCLNLPAFNRLEVDPKIDQVIGDFTSVLLFESDLREDLSFLERAKASQKRLWSDLANIQYSGIEFLAHLSQKDGNRIKIPYVFTSLIFPQNQDRPIVSRLGQLVNGISQTPHVWLDCQVYEENENLLINWDYIKALFDEEMLQEMFMDYRTLLCRLAADDIWENVEWRSQWANRVDRGAIFEANQTEKKSFGQHLLHQGFLEQVRKNPDNVAVIGSVRLDYKSLEKITANLASKISCMNFQIQDRVGIVMPKGWEQSAAAIAILRAGGAFVPLDPELPRDRLYSILESAEIKVVLTTPEVNSSVHWPEGVQPLEVTTRAHTECYQWFELEINPNSLAYVIFTSGSTGKPKGVMINHLAVANTIADINQKVSLTSLDRVIALSSLSFDLSVYDIFGPLSVGAAIVTPTAEFEKDPSHWMDLVLMHGVTIWNSVPALVDLFVGHLEIENKVIESLRVIMMSGDWINTSLPERINKVVSSTINISLGGATEASIWSIYHIIESVDTTLLSIPYGKALANQKMYVLDSHLRLRPKGVIGELYIGGVGLAAGYLKNPEESNYRFVQHPVTKERMYRTGDLGRWMPDGSIEFLGRKDNQIKINGFRVELGEIEKVACELPQIRACVTVPSKRKGVTTLVSYVQPWQGQALNVEEIETFFKSKLPSYMVPVEIVTLSQFPLSSNGKVDLKKLPVPAVRQDEISNSPQTETEREVAAMVSQIIDVDTVCIKTDLYQLGFDSRQLTILVTKIRSKFTKAFPLRKVFELPTVQKISAAIDELITGREEYFELEPILKKARANNWPLSSAQMRLWFHEQLHPNSSTYNLVDAFRFSGDLNSDLLVMAFDIFVSRHRILRSQLVDLDGEVCMRELPNDQSNLVVEKVLVSSELQSEQFIVEAISRETNRPFNFSSGELFRVRLLHFSSIHHVLIISAHHIIWDGWSTSLMIQEINSLYRQLCQNQRPSVKSEVVDFADFAIWELNQQPSQQFQKQLQYWQIQLGGDLPTLALPVESFRVSESMQSGARQSFLIKTELAEQFDRYCLKEGLTRFMGYLTVWQLLLHWWCKQNDIVVGTPTGHRARPELTEVIGYLVNSLAIRTQINDKDSFKVLCQIVRKTCIEAYGNQDIPFDQVVRAIRPKRKLTESAPVYRSWFVLHDIPLPRWEIGDIEGQTLDAQFLLDVHDIKLSLVSSQNRMEGGIDYRTSLLQEKTIANLCTTFLRLIEKVVSDPNLEISKVKTFLDEIQKDLEANNETTSHLKWDFSRSRRDGRGHIK